MLNKVKGAVTVNDTEQLRHVVKQVALKAGVPVSEVLQWPSKRLQPYLDELIAIDMTVIRDGARRAIVMKRVMHLIETSGMPKSLTVMEGIDAGHLVENDVINAQAVTEADIDQFLATTA